MQEAIIIHSQTLMKWMIVGQNLKTLINISKLKSSIIVFNLMSVFISDVLSLLYTNLLLA